MTFSIKTFTAILALLITVLAIRPTVVKDILGSAIVQSSTETVQTIGSLIPSNIISYIEPIKPVSVTRSDAELSVEAIIDATNKERIKAGLIPLRSNARLTQSATTKTRDMITRDYFEHQSPDGKGVADLALAAGYDYVIVGENLARGGFASASDLVNEWMNSPGHRANMLSSKYEEIGVYAAQGMYDGHEVWFAVQHFGTSRATCPVISERLKIEIDTMNADLGNRRAQIASEKAALEAPNHPEGDEYRARVTTFNALVAEYNTILVISQEKIKAYNAQVAAFNNCLTVYKPVK
jgi:uncharacterized protein YkwD